MLACSLARQGISAASLGLCCHLQMLGAKGSALKKKSEGDAAQDAEARPPVGAAQEQQVENGKPEVRAAACKHANGSAFDA